MEILFFALLGMFTAGSQAWLIPPITKTNMWSSKHFVQPNDMVENMSIQSLDSDHEAEGLRMASSIALWLDMEWMPQSVHRKIADVVKDSYIASRNANEHEVASIMFKVAEDLEVHWMQFEKEGAFTSNWDVANYVSDYLANRVGIKGCECSAKIIDPNQLNYGSK